MQLDTEKHKVLDSQTCYVCQHDDPGNEVAFCGIRGRTRSMSTPVRDSHNVCHVCLTEQLSRGMFECGGCRREMDSDLILQVPWDRRPAVREAIARGRRTAPVNWDDEVTMQFLEHEQAAIAARVNPQNYVDVPEGRLPLVGDDSFWQINGETWWQNRKPKRLPVMFYAVQFNHPLQTLLFLAMSGYHEQFIAVFEFYEFMDLYAHGQSISLHAIQQHLPNLLYDVMQFSDDLPSIDNSGRMFVVDFLLQECNVPFHVPVYFDESTLEMVMKEKYGPLYKILDFCEQNFDSLLNNDRGEQIHWLNFSTEDDSTLLHLLMTRKFRSILKMDWTYMEWYLQVDSKYIDRVMREIVRYNHRVLHALLSATANNQQYHMEDFVSHRNIFGHTALEAAFLQYDTRITSIHRRKDEATSLWEWKIRMNRLQKTLDYLQSDNPTFHVDLSKLLMHHMHFCGNIMTAFHYNENRTDLAYTISHYQDILVVFNSVIRKLIDIYFRFTTDNPGMVYPKPAFQIDEYKLLVLMVRMQDLTTVKKIVEQNRFGGDINHVLHDLNYEEATAANSVNYWASTLYYIDSETRADMENFLLLHGAFIAEHMSVNYLTASHEGL